jgi:hypothetical protein
LSTQGNVLNKDIIIHSETRIWYAWIYYAQNTICHCQNLNKFANGIIALTWLWFVFQYRMMHFYCIFSGKSSLLIYLQVIVCLNCLICICVLYFHWSEFVLLSVSMFRVLSLFMYVITGAYLPCKYKQILSNQPSGFVFINYWVGWRQ